MTYRDRSVRQTAGLMILKPSVQIRLLLLPPWRNLAAQGFCKPQVAGASADVGLCGDVRAWMNEPDLRGILLRAKLKIRLRNLVP